MSIFDDMFDSEFFFDSDYRQRRDIRSLQRQLLAAPDHGAQVRANTARIEQLELLCTSLVELLVAKGLATAPELRVLMQQLDLADGVEDGRIAKRVRDDSPRCGHCQRFVNPSRESCVYCGTPMAPTSPAAAAVKTVRVEVACSSCGVRVAETDSYFTGAGLVCEGCFDG